jgi:hypothetical protein
MADKPGDSEPRPKIVDLRAEPDEGGEASRDERREDHVSLPTGRPPMSALGSGKWRAEDLVGDLEELPDSAGKAAVTVLDPRLEELEPLIGRSDWGAIADKLGPFESAGALPPQLGLIYAIAVNETQFVSLASTSSGARSDGNNTTDLALRCVASMCGVPDASGFALVIAKRLLRKNPSTLRGVQLAPAPRPAPSPVVPIVMLIVGGAAGWFLRRVLHF